MVVTKVRWHQQKILPGTRSNSTSTDFVQCAFVLSCCYFLLASFRNSHVVPCRLALHMYMCRMSTYARRTKFDTCVRYLLDFSRGSQSGKICVRIFIAITIGTSRLFVCVDDHTCGPPTCKYINPLLKHQKLRTKSDTTIVLVSHGSYYY